MIYDCQNILKWTEAQLKYNFDVTLKQATPQELHQALGTAVMMAISDNWSKARKARNTQRKAFYISAEYLIGRLVYSNMFNLGIQQHDKYQSSQHHYRLEILFSLRSQLEIIYGTILLDAAQHQQNAADDQSHCTYKGEKDALITWLIMH